MNAPVFDRRLVIGTHNQKKGAELAELLAPWGFSVATLAEFPTAIDVVEDGDTFAANAVLKATQQAEHLGRWVLADDSGLEVDALGGAPGVFSARFAARSSPGEGARSSPGPGEGPGEDPHLSIAGRRHTSSKPLLDSGVSRLCASSFESIKQTRRNYCGAYCATVVLATFKFRSQHPIAPYVLDFYCHEAKLAVELDGGQHNTDEEKRRDENRTEFFIDQGISRSAVLEP